VKREWGSGGHFGGEWETASRSDLHLLRKAIRQRWPVPPERRRPLMDAVTSAFYRKDAPVRLTVAIARLVADAPTRALEEELAEAPPLSGPGTPLGDAEPAAPGPALASLPIGIPDAERAPSRSPEPPPALPEPPPGRRPPRPRRTPRRPRKARGRPRGRTKRNRTPPGRARLPRRPCIVPWAVSRCSAPSASPHPLDRAGTPRYAGRMDTEPDSQAIAPG
jgi:hypothetical protein